MCEYAHGQNGTSSGACVICPMTELSKLLFENDPCPQSCPTTKFIHITVPVSGAYRGSSQG